MREFIGGAFIFFACIAGLFFIGYALAELKSKKFKKAFKNVGKALISWLIFMIIGVFILPEADNVAKEEPKQQVTKEKVKEKPAPAKVVVAKPQVPVKKPDAVDAPEVEPEEEYDFVIYIPSDRYPYTADHVKDAIKAGESDICTIDREGADENRRESLAGIDTAPGMDRDEFPMAMCEEGGNGADVRLVPLSDNRGEGSWFGHQVSDYQDGARIKIAVE